MKRTGLYLLLVLSFLFFRYQSSADEDIYDLQLVEKDSVYFVYDFQQGDLITYRVESKDSIIIDFGEALVRERWERFTVLCDSVSSEGLFHLTLKYTDYQAIESRGNIKDVRRTNSPWTDRSIHLVIDSLGRRISISPDNKNNVAIAPGGAFQPYLFITIDQNCKAINESWLVSGIDTVYENGVPPSIVEYSSLYRAEADIDTLDHLCSQFRFIITANGQYNLSTEEQKISTVAILNSGGRMMISKDLKIPIFFYQSIEQKLRIYLREDYAKIGTHFTNANFVLESFSRKE